MLQLPDEIPVYMRNAFSKSEIARILVTVGISAFFANQYDVLRCAVRLADNFVENIAETQFVNKSEHSALISTFMRLWCVELDILFLECQDNQTFDATWAPLSVRLDTLKFRCRLITTPALRGLAEQRLRFHEARLANNDSSTGKCPFELVNTCMDTADKINRQLKNSAGAMSGRNVRMLIKILLGDPAFEDREFSVEAFEEQSERLQKATVLHAHNIARLSRFSGGDRVSSLIDAALIELTRGNFLSAHDFMSQADDSIYYPNLSLNLKLDLLWHRAQVSYVIGKDGESADFESIGWDKSDFFKSALNSAGDLQTLCRGGFPFFFARATLLQAMIRQEAEEATERFPPLSEAVETLNSLNSPLVQLGNAMMQALSE